jgi:hypothetical protein
VATGPTETVPTETITKKQFHGPAPRKKRKPKAVFAGTTKKLAKITKKLAKIALRTVGGSRSGTNRKSTYIPLVTRPIPKYRRSRNRKNSGVKSEKMGPPEK